MNQPGGKVCKTPFICKATRILQSHLMCHGRSPLHLSVFQHYDKIPLPIGLLKEKVILSLDFNGVSPVIPTALVEAVHDCWRTQWNKHVCLCDQEAKGDREEAAHPVSSSSQGPRLSDP